MARLQKRRTKDGKTRHRVQVRLKGYPPQSATFDRKSDAREWADQTEADMRRGRHLGPRAARTHTVADLVDRYTERVIPKKKAWAQDQVGQLAWFRSQIGAYALADVTPPLLADCRDALEADHTAATTNRYMAALSHAFTKAVREWGWLEVNPARNVDRCREPRGRTRFLDQDDELPQFLSALDRAHAPPVNCAPLRPICLVALSAGPRKGELLGLRWPRVNFRRSQLTFEKTKNGEIRTVPLVGPARAALCALSKVRRIDTDLVFPHPTQPRPIDIRGPWRRLLAEAGIEDFTFHGLRHTAASYLMMNGATDVEIAEICGWKTLQMVKRYTHLKDSHTAAVVERMNAQFIGVG